MFGFRKRTALPAPGEALPGRAQKIPTATRHAVNGHPLQGPWLAGFETAMFGLGCFWGAERKFWQLGEGVHSTAVGYAAGQTPNPTYDEVCSGLTGHNEVVLVVYDPAKISYEQLLKCFWESHNPTQGMRQGNDVGTQYRSGIFVEDEADLALAKATALQYGQALAARGFAAITTEIASGKPFYYAETEHQQYLSKNPNGYCGLGGTGVACAIGTGVGQSL
jgi:peptide-methionine (S)-S-oxide reductase